MSSVFGAACMQRVDAHPAQQEVGRAAGRSACRRSPAGRANGRSPATATSSRATLTPKANWCPPRTSVTSSLTCHGVGREGRVAFGPAAELESGGIRAGGSDRQQHVVRHVAVDVDADFRRREEIGARAVDVRAVEREPHRFNVVELMTKFSPSVKRLGEVVAAADARHEQILLRRVEAERRRRELLRGDVAAEHRVLGVRSDSPPCRRIAIRRSRKASGTGPGRTGR